MKPTNNFESELARAELSVMPALRSLADRHPMRPQFADELGDRLATTIAAAPTPRRRLAWPLGAGLAAGFAAVLVAGAAFLLPHFTPEVDASDLLQQVQNAGEVVPVGKVRHVVTSYTLSPALDGVANRTMEQWFGNTNGRLVSSQTGPMGERTVVDATGTHWMAPRDGNEVIRMVDHQGRLPVLTPNRAAMTPVNPAESQARVVGRSTVQGRAVTTMELTRTIAPFPSPADLAAGPRPSDSSSAPGRRIGNGPPPEAPAGVRIIEERTLVEPADGQRPAKAPEMFGLLFDASGALVMAPPGGGMVLSRVVVDDQTRQILQGRIESRDASGVVVGTTEWRVTLDELLDVAQVNPTLFTYTPRPGATVRELAPGNPIEFNIRIER